ncbi:MAG: carboxypeptidase-like regulatory domain-containing protein, partial [Phycisphaerae bacterium]
FLDRGDTDTFNKALEVFAKVRAPSLELIVSDGPAESRILRDDRVPKSNGRYDWDFVIWDVRSYYRLYGNPTSTFLSRAPDFRRPLPPPRINVFIGGGGAVEWDKVQVPDGIVVIDRRGSAAGIKAGQGAVIAGNVFDMATSKPLADAKITVEQARGNREYETVATGQSDAQGRFKIVKVPAGTYRVSVSAEGYASLVVAYKRLVAGGYLPFDDVELAPQATVSGSVMDDAGKPIAGADVRLVDTMGMNGQGYHLVEPARVTTDAEGRFHFAGVPTGFGRVVCFAKGHHSPIQELRPVPGKDLTIRMSDTGTIKGKVIGGRPKGGNIHVSVAPEGGDRIGTWGGSMRVKPDGTFQFDNVPPGTYVISRRPQIPGIAPDPKARKIKVVAGQTVMVELEQ